MCLICQVFRGNWEIKKSNGDQQIYRPVAIKTLNPKTMSKGKFLQEANIMKGLDHPNVVKLFAIVSIDEPLWIITEFVEQGDLRKYLLNELDKGINMDQERLRDICYQVCLFCILQKQV